MQNQIIRMGIIRYNLQINNLPYQNQNLIHYLFKNKHQFQSKTFLRGKTIVDLVQDFLTRNRNILRAKNLHHQQDQIVPKGVKHLLEV